MADKCIVQLLNFGELLRREALLSAAIKALGGTPGFPGKLQMSCQPIDSHVRVKFETAERAKDFVEQRFKMRDGCVHTTAEGTVRNIIVKHDRPLNERLQFQAVGRIKKTVNQFLIDKGLTSTAEASGGRICVGNSQGTLTAVAYVKRGEGKEEPKMFFLEEEFKKLGLDASAIESQVRAAVASRG